MTKTYSELNPSPRILMGPGPSDVHPRVLRAMSASLVGHLDPDFINIMEETKELLRYVFQTTNELTISVSGTGSAGMEACLCNLIEEGDEVLVCVNGFFGERMSDIVERYGGRLTRVEAEWGKPIEPDQVENVLKKKKVKVVAIVHAETSTGVLQPLTEISRIVHNHGALLLADTVTSLGGHPVKVDEWGIDAIYSASQKCLSCTPGLSPVSFSERVVEYVKARKDKIHSWFMDMNLLLGYWGATTRTYHHTAPTNALFALHEALLLIHEEGLENSWARHRRHHTALKAGLEAMGLKFLVKPEYQLPQMNAVLCPDGVEEAAVRRMLLTEFNLEIGAGLGPLAGKIWRFGIMGYSCRPDNVMLCLAALGSVLSDMGLPVHVGDAEAAAHAAYAAMHAKAAQAKAKTRSKVAA